MAIEPVLMLGVSILQELDGVPDRQAVEMLRYHAGWNFGLNRQLGDPGFHPTSLVNFRNRLNKHKKAALGFQTVLEALQEAGLVSRQSRQRLDSTQMFGRVAKMSRLDCVRETMRLALQELETATAPAERPVFWIALWERYVESQVDYRANSETLARKLGEAGADAWQLLSWLGEPAQGQRMADVQAQLLKRVFGEQFDVVAGKALPQPEEKQLIEDITQSSDMGQAQESGPTSAPVAETAAETAVSSALRQPTASPEADPAQSEFPGQLISSEAVEPKGKGELSSGSLKGQVSKFKFQDLVSGQLENRASISKQTQPTLDRFFNLLEMICLQVANSADELGERHREHSLDVKGAGLQKRDLNVDFELRSSIGRRVGNDSDERVILIAVRHADHKDGANLASHS